MSTTPKVGEQLEGPANKLALIERLHDLADVYHTCAERNNRHGRATLGLTQRMRALELEMRALEVAVTL
jgi:hypothetical protein